MPNYNRPQTRQLSSHLERKKLREDANNKNIVEVAQQLGMTLERIGKDYQWKDHDSLKFDTRKNYFYWNAQGFGGGPIKLAQTIMECSYGEAVRFLTGKEISKFDKNLIPKKEFKYFLSETPYATELKVFTSQKRQISNETLDFLINQGVLAQSKYKDRGQEQPDPVIVFKNIDSNGEIKGMALQGMIDHPDLYPGRDKLKKTFGNGSYGCVVKVGNPPTNKTMTLEHPLKIIAFEAGFDMMAYLDLFKEKIGDAYLVAMHGRKKSVISTTLANALNVPGTDEGKATMLDVIENSTNGIDAVKIILAVDNDEAGRKFVEDFGITKVSVIPHLPKVTPGEKKSDWNEILQRIKTPQKSPFEERLKKAAEARPDFAARLRQAAETKQK